MYTIYVENEPLHNGCKFNLIRNSFSFNYESGPRPKFEEILYSQDKSYCLW